MPRIWKRLAAPGLLAVLCAAVPPAALHAALAAAAGTLFETAPFVLAAEFLANRRFGAFVEAFGCGCGRTLPGAVSLPATALTWLTFGPVVAGLRLASALVLIALRRREACGAPPERPGCEPLNELAALAPSALVAGLAAQALSALPRSVSATPGSPVEVAFATLPAFVAGAALGVLAPCTTAGIALAGGLAPHLPALAAGVLSTCGLVPRLRFGGGSDSLPSGATRAAPLARIALAVTLVALAIRGPAGFVNPRLRITEAAGALLAIAGVRRPARPGRRGALIPGALLAALAAGSPVPAYEADPTRLADAFPGEAVHFLGVAASAGGATTLERYVITCCRVDAAPLSVRLDRPLPAAYDGTWIQADGALEQGPHGELVLRPSSWRRTPAPPDPFAYR